jgi:hypothetical protein
MKAKVRVYTRADRRSKWDKSIAPIRIEREYKLEIDWYLRIGQGYATIWGTRQLGANFLSFKENIPFCGRCLELRRLSYLLIFK